MLLENGVCVSTSRYISGLPHASEIVFPDGTVVRISGELAVRYGHVYRIIIEEESIDLGAGI